MKTAPCLATGNVMIIKPSEQSPLGSLAIASLFKAAGFPPGVLQIVTGAGETGGLLSSHMRVRKISFTGSITTGRKIQIASAQSNLKRVTLELGGKSPAVVFADADLENALTWCVNGVLARSGQVCVAATRLYVQKSIADDFIAKYVARMKAAAAGLGDPSKAETVLGPLVNKAALERVTNMIERGRAEAELVVGGVRRGAAGCFVEPTVFVNPHDGAQIYTDEVFGPVAVVRTFETEEEVVAMANDTEYGLMAGVFTRDLNRALRLSSQIDAGVVGVNCVSSVCILFRCCPPYPDLPVADFTIQMNVQAPFGGKKQSGVGREFGEYVSIVSVAGHGTTLVDAQCKMLTCRLDRSCAHTRSRTLF